MRLNSPVSATTKLCFLSCWSSVLSSFTLFVGVDPTAYSAGFIENLTQQYLKTIFQSAQIKNIQLTFQNLQTNNFAFFVFFSYSYLAKFIRWFVFGDYKFFLYSSHKYIKKMPKMVDNIVFERKIGSGKFGEVFQGYNNNNMNQVAIKAIKRRNEKHNKLMQLLESEIKVLKACDNPNIIKLYEIKKTSNNFYLILEYCNGGDLMSYLRRKKLLQQEQAVGFLLQILNGFKTLAQNKILHRDLKLENILLHNGEIKIGDFGFSKMLTEQEQTKTQLGSLLNMAPEILCGKSYNSKADIWSLGVCFYELLFGTSPFKAQEIIDFVNNTKIINLQFPRVINSISTVTQNLLRSMLEIEPEKRISWEELFNHPINTFLEDGMQKDQESLEDLSKGLAMYYLESDFQKSSSNSNSSNQFSMKEKSQTSEQNRKSSKNSDVNKVFRSDKNNQIEAESEEKKILKSFQRNNNKLLHYRNIYALLASIADESINQSQQVMFSSIAGYLIMKKMLSLIQILIEKMYRKDSFPEMENWQNYIQTKDFFKIRNYIQNQYKSYQKFFKKAHEKLQKIINDLGEQIGGAFSSLNSPLPQNLYIKYLKQYIKNLHSVETMKKLDLGPQQKKQYIHLSRVIDCLNIEQNFQYESNGVIFDIMDYYNKTQRVTVDQLKTQIQKKLSII